MLISDLLPEISLSATLASLPEQSPFTRDRCLVAVHLRDLLNGIYKAVEFGS